MRAAAAIIGVVALLGLAAYAGQAKATADNAAPETTESLEEGPDMIDTAAQEVAGGNPFAMMDRSTIEASQADTNCAAMLQAISHGEGTDRAGVDPYEVCFAYAHTVQDFAFHPCEGIKDGRASGPEWAGFTDKAGAWHSPAGRYQITLATFSELPVRQ